MLYQRTVHGLMTVSWLSNFCFRILIVELSLFMMRSFIFVKMLNCSNKHLFLQCSNARSPVISSEPTSAQCKACSDNLFCARSRTSWSSLVFLTFALFRAILLHATTLAVNNCSSFQIQLGISHFHLQALTSLFRNSHWTSVHFHGPQYGRIPMNYKPLTAVRSIFKK